MFDKLDKPVIIMYHIFSSLLAQPKFLTFTIKVTQHIYSKYTVLSSLQQHPLIDLKMFKVLLLTNKVYER